MFAHWKVTVSVAANWYPDPHNPAFVRYWDGQQWTQHVAPRQGATPSPQARPVTQSAPAAQQPVAPRMAAESGQWSPQVVQSSTRQSPDTQPNRHDQRVPTFGAKKFAEQLQEENAHLRSIISRYALDDTIESERRKMELQGQLDSSRRDLAAVSEQVVGARGELARLGEQIVGARHTIDLQELGIFDYEHPAESSTVLATQLEALRGRIKQTVRDGGATSATTQFTFNNSVAKGKKFVSDMSKLLLRAYNAEAENCVKSVRAGNLATAQKRLSTVVDQIARQGTMIDLHITPHYHGLRLHELELAARHLQTVQREKELERERREELREQRKAEQELAREQEKLNKEKSHYLSTLAVLQANGDEAGVARLQAQLADVERALADVDYRAANIRAGHVYVISNVGAFGRDMVKIGMTRRLEPMDRVTELGDASVPFRFDVHALFFAQDAVSVEAALHRRFAERRVNKVNLRREFFRVTPDEVLDAIRDEQIEIVEFSVDVAGEEYLASVASAVEASAS